jgi:hypothetical protein
MTTPSMITERLVEFTISVSAPGTHGLSIVGRGDPIEPIVHTGWTLNASSWSQ